MTLLLAQSRCAPYPARPWIQYGDGWVFQTEIDVSAARTIVPASFDIIETKRGSGKTNGAVYLVQYTAESTVVYSEAIFVCAEVSYKGAHTGNWVGNIWVDNEAALQAGREVWKLQKEMATFEWSASTAPAPASEAATAAGEHIQRVTITTPASDVVGSFNFTRSLIPIPWQHQVVKTFSLDNATGTVLLSQTAQKYTIHMLPNVDVLIPPTSPLSSWMPMGGFKIGAKVELKGGMYNMTNPQPLTSAALKSE